jgi:predicted Rossmann fold nucleotide-binding protein DprA/Smf involved in DNA uptake
MSVTAVPNPANRDVREVIRDEHIMRRRILEMLKAEPRTIPEIAEGLGRPAHEVTFWVMGMRKYGYVAEDKEVTDEGYYRYRSTKEAAEQ